MYMKRKNKLKEIEKQITDIDKKIFEDPTSEVSHNSSDLRTFLINEMNLELKQQADASHIRSKAKWIEEGGKNTPYFLSLEKKTPK